MMKFESTTGGEQAYVVGKGGQTRIRLENLSGAKLDVGDDGVQIRGSGHAVELAKLMVTITLQQRSDYRGDKLDFNEIKDRTDVTTLDVPKSCVGFVLGSRAATMRLLETKHNCFMFFDNETRRDAEKKRLFMIAASESARKAALEEIEGIVEFKMTGVSTRGPPTRGPRSNFGPSGGYPRRDDYRGGGGGYRDDYRGGGGGGYRDDRDRGPRRDEYRRDRRSRSRSPPRRDRRDRSRSRSPPRRRSRSPPRERRGGDDRSYRR